MPKFLRQNLGLKILCLVISVVMWGALRYTAPIDYKTMYQTSMYVPVTYSNVPDGFVPSSKEEHVLAEIKGSPEILSMISPSQFAASLDLTGLKEGTHTLDVKIKFPPGVTITKLQPAKITFVLERFKSVELPVKLSVSGNPAFGYSVKRTSAIPSEIRISGSESKISQISSVCAEANISDMNSFTRFSLPVRVLDKQGNDISGLTVSDERIIASVNITPGYKIRHLAVLPLYEGELPEGMEIDRIAIVPEFVMARINEDSGFKSDYINSEPIDLNSLTARNSFVRALKFPKGVSPADIDKVKVFITLKKKG